MLFFHLVPHYAYLQCAGGARSHYEDMGIADSNTHAQNNTSHLSPKVIVADQTVLEESNIRTSAKKNPLIPLSNYRCTFPLLQVKSYTKKALFFTFFNCKTFFCQ